MKSISLCPVTLSVCSQILVAEVGKIRVNDSFVLLKMSSPSTYFLGRLHDQLILTNMCSYSRNNKVFSFHMVGSSNEDIQIFSIFLKAGKVT